MKVCIQCIHTLLHVQILSNQVFVALVSYIVLSVDVQNYNMDASYLMEKLDVIVNLSLIEEHSCLYSILLFKVSVDFY